MKNSIFSEFLPQSNGEEHSDVNPHLTKIPENRQRMRKRPKKTHIARIASRKHWCKG